MKTGLFGITRAAVPMENQSVFSWLLYIMREEEDAAGREVFSLVDGYQERVSLSLSETSLSCLEAWRRRSRKK